MPTNDPAKQRAYTKKWYERNKEKHMQTTARNKARYREMWVEFKSKQKCVHCGISHPAIIDFHHVIRKNSRKVHKLAANGAYKQAVKEAEEKCITLCSNCHRILHWNETLSRQAERKQLSDNDGDGYSNPERAKDA